MISFPATYGLDTKQLIQGPTKLWYAPYVPNGAAPAQNTIKSLGMLDKSGIEFDHKPTYGDVEVDQSTSPVDTFLTKQDWSLKATLVELSPANVQFLLGCQAAALVNGGGVSTLSLGDPFDVPAGANPSMRPPIFCVIFQFPSPGHDQTTSPPGAWGYYQFYKAYVNTHGAIKYGKDTLSSANVTIRALTDITVAGASKVGQKIDQ